MSHLTAARLHTLLTTPAGDRELQAHLEAGCDECDRFLADEATLDGPVDAVLLRLAPRRIGTPAQTTPAVSVPSRRRRSLAIAAGVLLVFAALAAINVTKGAQGSEGIKGSGPPAIELSAAVRQADGSVRPLADGDVVSSADTVVLQTQASLDGAALVLLQRGDARPEVIGDARLVAGPQFLRRGDGMLGVSLEGEHGDVTVWVVVGAAPPAPDEALAAIAFPSRSFTRAAVHLRVQP